MVSEYVHRGDLRTLIRKKLIELNEKSRMKILIDIASGMSHLHSNGVLHRDLALRNVLIDNMWNAKITGNVLLLIRFFLKNIHKKLYINKLIILNKLKYNLNI